MAGDVGRATGRVVESLAAGEDPVATLASGVTGADLTSFLLDVMHARAGAVTPTELVRRSLRDRFLEPGRVDARALHRTVAAVVDALPPTFELVELSPVAALGTCSAIATVDQRKVVATTRGTEVAADPTNALAVLAAGRGGDLARTERLAAVQRVVRAQPQPGQAHFTVLGVVVAGRDRGHLGFEAEALAEVLRAFVAITAAVSDRPVEIRLTPLSDDGAALVGALADLPARTVVDDDRLAGRGYYRDVCCKVILDPDGDAIEVGDGGATDWTARLTGNRKARTVIGGLGVDRLAGLRHRT